MPKRKRETPEGGEDAAKTAAQPSLKQLRAEQKFEHGAKLLTRAFKTARGFERQKLGRRHKTASSSKNTADVARIDAEVAALKTLDLQVVASSYLCKSLLKFKAVATSTDLPRSLSTPTHQPSDTAALNVIARLCNSNPVREALTPTLREVQKALGIDVDASGTKATKRVRTKEPKVEAVKEQDADLSGSGDDEELGNQAIAKLLKRRQEAADSGSEDEPDDDFADFDARIAGSSDEEEEDDGPDFRRASSEEPDDAADLLSLADEDEDQPDLSEDEAQQPRKGASTKRAAAEHSETDSDSNLASPPPQKATKSAFLPSLTMGGYISGSEDDNDPFEDFDDNGAKPKKNRRGQRARQAIWEKKFGQGAKHIKEGDKSKTSDKRSEGWDLKRGATDSGGRGGRFSRGGSGGRGGRGGRPALGGRGERSANTEAPKKKHRDDAGELHPSWLAAKKAKEAKAPTVSFQGKKITFD